MIKNKVNKGNALALLPIGVFLLLFKGSGIITGDFYKMPALVAFIVAILVVDKFIKLLKKYPMKYFSYYRIAIAILLIMLVFFKVIKV